MIALLALVALVIPSQAPGASWPSPLAYDELLTRRLANGCTYSLRISGSVHGDPASLVSALSVAAGVDCAAAATLLGADDVVWQGPNSVAGLEADLEARGRVVTDLPRRACTYTPDLVLEAGSVRLRNVTVRCGG
jgi:hypothetical protein